MRPFGEAIRPMISLLSLFIISTIWVLASPNSIVNMEPRMFIVLSGTIFSNINVSLSIGFIMNAANDFFP